MSTFDTRPMWQLLVSLSHFLSSKQNEEISEIVRARLRQLEAFLLADDRVDPGGECLRRIQQLINRTV